MITSFDSHRVSFYTVAMNRLLRAGLCLLMLQPGVCCSAPALVVRMAADTLTVHAQHAPLSEILARFHDAGVQVAMDDRIDPSITADFEGRETGEAVKWLLADCDYALSWQTVEGPAGKMRRLSEILVYKPGDRRTLKSLQVPPVAAVQAVRTNSVVCLKNEILIRLKAGTTKEQFRALLIDAGATVMDGIPALGLYRLRLSPGASLADILNALAKNPVTDRAEPNQVYRSFEPTRSDGAGISTVARNMTSSGGPGVAILDSGYTPTAALDKAVTASFDAVSPGQAISDPAGHGTQMALIAGGAVAPLGTTASGAAVSVIPVRAMDDQGISSGFSLMQGMVFALDNGARVINMSWGSETDSGFMNAAIAYAREHGAVLVAAAGNEPTGRPWYPAALPGVVAVAALDPTGNVWDHSNYGSFVTLAAPGFAGMPVGYKGPPGLYGGTSISAAYTARAIAQYFVANPTATAADAVAALGKAVTLSAAGVAHPEIPRLDTTAVNAYLKP